MVRFYLVFSVIGILLPYGALVPWLITNGFDFAKLLNDALTNPISVLAWLDVLVSVVVLLGFILVDGKRNQVKYRFFAIFGTLSVGASFGLPLYLYFKESQRVK